MLDREVLSELQAIAVRGAEAADHGGREDELLEAYDALRARAATLARVHGLATPEQAPARTSITSFGPGWLRIR